MWYVSCNKWKDKNLPFYDIKFAISKNLTDWNQTGISCIKLKKGERAVARPFVTYKNRVFKMWYCYEKNTDGYKIGYAESNDGKKWIRKDNKIKFLNSFICFRYRIHKSYTDKILNCKHAYNVDQTAMIGNSA